MIRNTVALVIGLAIGMFWNSCLVFLNSTILFPMEEGADMMNSNQMKTYIATLPTAGFFVVIAAHVGQAVFGGWIAARFCRSKPRLWPWIIGVLTAASAGYNLVTLGGPAWMWIELPIIFIASWWIGEAEVARRQRAERQDARA